MLVRPDDQGFYLLDRLGALIWELCDGVRTMDELIDAVADRIDEPRAAVAGDVREWLAELAVERLLVDVG